MADDFGDRPVALTLAVAADLGHRDLEVMVEQRQPHGAEEHELRYTAVEERLGRLARLRFHKSRLGLRLVHA